jgi:hypothetical protein
MLGAYKVVATKGATGMNAADMNDIRRTARDRDILLENFAAELTSIAYPLVLRQEPKDWWIKVEIALWRARTETAEKWARELTLAASSAEFDAWREGFVADVTERVSSIALESGIEVRLLELEAGLAGAFRRVIGWRSGGTSSG